VAAIFAVASYWFQHCLHPIDFTPEHGICYILAVSETLRIGKAAELLRVSPDTVRRLIDSGQIKTARSPGGQRKIDGAALARYMASQPREKPPVVVGESARNRFQGIVTRVVKDGVAAQVEMHSGPHRIVSLMTRDAADELGLKPGVLAIASVKATNVVIELARS
jgi:molybdopterin-binding protein